MKHDTNIILGFIVGFLIAWAYSSVSSPQTGDRWQAYTYYYPNGMKEVRCVNTADSTWVNGNDVHPQAWGNMKLIDGGKCPGS